MKVYFSKVVMRLGKRESIRYRRVCVCVGLQTYSESAGIPLISDLND